MNGEYLYDIILHTLIGDKKGTLNLNIRNGKVNGSLTLLGKTKAVIGTIDTESLINLTGELSSLMSEYKFKAQGFADENEINITIFCELLKFRLTGIRRGSI